MKRDDTIKILEKNVRDLQKQLAEAHLRILELNDVIKEQQAKLSYYKNESI